MPEIICLAERKRARRISNNTQTIEKIVDGKIVKCVDLDVMNSLAASDLLRRRRARKCQRMRLCSRINNVAVSGRRRRRADAE